MAEIGISLLKDVKNYKQEKKVQKEKLHALVQSDASPHHVRQCEEALGETLAILPDTKMRLDNATEDLRALLVR